MATTTPTPFTWPAGPNSVLVSGDWDQWTDKVTLDKQLDGSFSKQIPLPSNTKVHYKYIVDGDWTTNSASPLVNDAGNQNNVVDVGPAPTATEAVTAKAAEIGGGVVAGAAAAATAAGAAATKFTDHVNGNTAEDATETEPKKEVTQADKIADPAATLKQGADEDIRNHVPSSLTTASHAAMPVLASAVATVTGADILRGNPEALPVTEEEVKKTQAEALKGGNSFVASPQEPQGGAITDPKAAVTDNAKAAASVANNATLGGPIVPVTHNGFAANVTADTGSLTTAADAGKTGGEKAGAVAAASSGALGATVVGATAASNGTNSESKPSTAPVTTSPDTKLPSTGSNVSKKEIDKAAAPAAASSGPLVTGKETTTPAAAPSLAQDKTLPVTPTKKKSTMDTKGDTIKGSKFNTVSNSRRKSGNVDSPGQDTSVTESDPSTPDRKRKQSIFGKIKSALSPHNSPGK